MAVACRRLHSSSSITSRSLRVLGIDGRCGAELVWLWVLVQKTLRIAWRRLHCGGAVAAKSPKRLCVSVYGENGRLLKVEQKLKISRLPGEMSRFLLVCEMCGVWKG